ncbi:hypothetical protein OG871_38160 [Kitasatospora sp. NBC_00374]|uniref:hypothetical protein n=1 Tax=Kitasatospora sp. NBC_00374 TaxID=2975964 RepID=UPI0030DF14B7
MTDQLSVDTDAIAMATPAVRALASETRDVSTSLIARLSAIGPAKWDDPIGQAFTEQYESAARSLQQGFEDTSTVIARTADGVHGMAKGFERTEQNNLDAIRVHGVPHDTGARPVKAPTVGRK